jgi:hypothetical protein
MNKDLLETELYILEHRRDYIDLLIKDIKWQLKELDKEE